MTTRAKINKGSSRELNRNSRSLWLIGLDFSCERIGDEVDHVVACDDPVPRFGAGRAGEVSSKCAVVLAWEEQHLHGNTLLPERAIHLLGLAIRIGGVGLA